jgi:hypothetical protein
VKTVVISFHFYLWRLRIPNSHVHVHVITKTYYIIVFLFLKFAEGGTESKPRDILLFATGAESIPPIPFQPPPSLAFHEEGQYPMASTCDCVLRLPLSHTDYEIFKASLDYGFLNALGFGRA